MRFPTLVALSQRQATLADPPFRSASEAIPPASQRPPESWTPRSDSEIASRSRSRSPAALLVQRKPSAVFRFHYRCGLPPHNLLLPDSVQGPPRFLLTRCDVP